MIMGDDVFSGLSSMKSANSFYSLALAEMRLILAKIVFNFDMHLDNGSKDWIGRQKAYFLWDKPSLNVYMTPVTR